MEDVSSNLFKKFKGNQVSYEGMEKINGGLDSPTSSSKTGDNDCTGDAVTPDCGDMIDASNVYKDSQPTSASDDSCTG